MFMTVKKNDGCNPELIYEVLVKKDDLSRRVNLYQVMCLFSS
jgi:hypothetical protein